MRQVVAGAGALIAFLILENRSGSQEVCQNLSGRILVTGESRYLTQSGSDECYTNQYFETSKAELSLGCGKRVGAPGNSLDESGLVEYGTWIAHQDDARSDCTDAVFFYGLKDLTDYHCLIPRPSIWEDSESCVRLKVRREFMNMVTMSSCSPAPQPSCGNRCLLSAALLQSIKQGGGEWGAWSNVWSRRGCRTVETINRGVGLPPLVFTGDSGCLSTSRGACIFTVIR